MFTSIISSLTARILFTFFTAFLTGLAIGPRVIENLKLRQIGQTIRDEGVQAHKKKAGIPTMGGMIILVPALITIVLWVKWNPFVFATLFAILASGFIGMMDDLTKVLKARSLGLTPRQKLAGQIITGLVVALVIRFLPGLRFEAFSDPSAAGTMIPAAASAIQVPLYGVFDLGWLFLPLALTAMVGATNAVNLTDGLDGLAAGTTCFALFPFILIAVISGSPVLAKTFGTLYIPGTEELAIIGAALAGGCLGFLWYNTHPAEVFMGDMGSLALGGAFGALAVCTKTELHLIIIGGLFVLEALSVITQVSYFKYTHGQRIFKMSPIHHHFELCGWAEEKVTIRFWVVAALFSLTGFFCYAWRIVF